MKTKIEILKIIHQSLQNGIKNPNASSAGKWLKDRCLTIESSQATFNSGQIHHRKEQEFKDELESVGFLKRAIAMHQHGIPYTIFGKLAILFPLRNEKEEVVNFYAIAIKKEKTEFLNQEGIYPCYPSAQTKRLIITETILDAATILESKILKAEESVIVIPDGKILTQHQQAIENLKQLQEVIYIEYSKKQ